MSQGMFHTVVDTYGVIISQTPSDNCRVEIVSGDHPERGTVLRVSEVSDDATINFFLHTDGNLVPSMLHDEEFVGKGNIDPDDPNWEILMNVKEGG